MMNKKTGLMLLLAGVAAGEAVAGNLNSYATGDVLVCFRNASSGNDLVVDAGPVSAFTNTTPGQIISVSQFTAAQLTQVGIDGMNWSAFTWLSDNTLFATSPRANNSTQTSPWQAAPSGTQSGTALRMATVPPGAKANLSFNGLNTATAIIEPDNPGPAYAQESNYRSGGQSYENAIVGAAGGNFNGTFIGNAEYATSGTFDTDGVVARSDFYQLKPAASAYVPTYGKFLGYFELSTGGVLKFVVPSSSASVPVIQSVSRSGNQTTIYYTTGVSGTYTLRKNSSLNSGVASANWTSVSALNSGDTALHSITFTDTSATDFYIITGQ